MARGEGRYSLLDLLSNLHFLVDYLFPLIIAQAELLGSNFLSFLC